MSKRRETMLRILIVAFCLGATLSCTLGGLLSTPSPTPTLTPTPTITSTPTPTPTPTPPTTAKLRLNLKKKNIFNVRMITDQEIIQTIEGEQQATLQKLGFSYTYAVSSVDSEGSSWVDVTYDWILWEQEGPMGKIAFDSSNPPQVVPPEALGYSALLGKGFSIKISPKGEILEIDGLEEMYAEMIADLDLEDDEARAMLEQMLYEQFGEEAIKNQANSCLINYPEGPVQIGDSWTATSETSIMVSMFIDYTYTLRAYDGRLATIDVQSVIQPNPEAGMTDLGIFKIGYALSGEQEGVVTLDTETGWTMSSTMTQNLTGEMTIVMGEEQLIVPISINSLISIETVKGGP